MKNLGKYSGVIALAAVALVTLVAPEVAYANPLIEGMTNKTALTIAKAMIMVVALIVLGGKTIPALMKGDGGEVIQSVLGVAVLVGVAIKLQDIMELFAKVL